MTIALVLAPGGQYELWCCSRCGGLVRWNTWRGLSLEKDVGFKIASRLGYMEVQRAGNAARERWADDGLTGRVIGHRCRWWSCEDVKVWRVGDGSKHRMGDR